MRGSKWTFADRSSSNQLGKCDFSVDDNWLMLQARLQFFYFVEQIKVAKLVLQRNFNRFQVVFLQDLNYISIP